MKINLNWSQLNQVREIKIISSMYIWIFVVPITAKLLSMTSDVATVTIFTYTFDVSLALPFSWKLFYFSALCFALATLIYKVRCPRLIKEHSTYASFDDEGKPEWHLRHYARDIGLEFNQYKDDFNDAMEEHAPIILKDKEYTQALFWDLHWRAGEERKITLHFCLASYAGGFIMIICVFVQNFIWVLANILR